MIILHYDHRLLTRIIQQDITDYHPGTCLPGGQTGSNFPTHHSGAMFPLLYKFRWAGVAKFYAQYFKELAKGLAKFKNYHKAYYAISFEQEAYAQQGNPLSEAERDELGVTV